MARGFTMERNATREERPPPSAVDTVSRPVATKINGSGRLRQGDEIFGRLIAVRRAALGLSQEDLAARMETSSVTVAGIENGLPPRLETLERLAAALAAEGRTGPAWRSLRGRWAWGGVAIAILVPALVILNGRSSETDGDASSGPLSETESPATTSAAPVIRVGAQEQPRWAQGTKAQKAQEAHKAKGAAPRPERGGAGDEAPRPSAPEATLTPTSPGKPAPAPPAGNQSPQQPTSGSPSPPPEPLPDPTGKPEGTPGNGPGGSGGSGGGTGPGGTGPPGQSR